MAPAALMTLPLRHLIATFSCITDTAVSVCTERFLSLLCLYLSTASLTSLTRHFVLHPLFHLNLYLDSCSFFSFLFIRSTDRCVTDEYPLRVCRHLIPNSTSCIDAKGQLPLGLSIDYCWYYSGMLLILLTTTSIGCHVESSPWMTRCLLSPCLSSLSLLPSLRHLSLSHFPSLSSCPVYICHASSPPCAYRGLPQHSYTPVHASVSR